MLERRTGVGRARRGMWLVAALGLSVLPATAHADAGPRCRCEAPGYDTSGWGLAVGLIVPGAVLTLALVRRRARRVPEALTRDGGDE